MEGQIHIQHCTESSGQAVIFNVQVHCCILYHTWLHTCGCIYMNEVTGYPLHLLQRFSLEPAQRTELFLLVPPCLRSTLCVHVLTCFAACAGNAAADAGSQCSSAPGFPGQAQGVRAGQAAAAAAVCDFCSRHSCKQCKCRRGCSRQVSAWAAGAAGCQGRDGIPLCRDGRQYQRHQQLQASCSSCSLLSSPAASFLSPNLTSKAAPVFAQLEVVAREQVLSQLPAISC